MAENEPIKICPKCNEEMVEGFILELADGNSKSVSNWVAGKPELSFWRGLKTSDRSVYKIISFRCTSCGYLESYAQG